MGGMMRKLSEVVASTKPLAKTIGEQRQEDEVRLKAIELNPGSALPEDVTWLILQLRIARNTIPNDGYYC